MFGMSPWHIAVLVVVGLVVFGPDKLPGMIKDLGKALRQVRAQAQTMQEDLKSELGPEVGDLDLRSLHPRTFVEKHLFGDGEEDVLGLKALLKDEDDEPAVSFDKPEAFSEPAAASADRVIEQPRGPEPISMSKHHGVKFDADAT
jgi:sec-independent protein translocase protein TatB